jgi:hypothetical protein
MNVEIGTETRYLFSGNICFKISVFCLCSVVTPRDDIEITHDLPFFSVAQGIFVLSSERLSRSTLHLIEGEERSVYSCIL